MIGLVRLPHYSIPTHHTRVWAGQKIKHYTYRVGVGRRPLLSKPKGFERDFQFNFNLIFISSPLGIFNCSSALHYYPLT